MANLFPAFSRALCLLAWLTLGWCLVGEASAATCTSRTTGNWSSSSTWTCTGTPSATVPSANDSVILASPYTVTVDNGFSAASITINAGASLNTGQNNLTVSGNFTNNGSLSGNQGTVSIGGNLVNAGTFDLNQGVCSVTGNITNTGTITDTGGGGILAAIGNATVISGNGTYAGSMRLYTSGTAVSIAAGSTLTFTGTAVIRAGRTTNGSTNAGSVLTINGTIVTSQTAGTQFMRLYANSTIIGSSGVINAASSNITYSNAVSQLTNNGQVSVQAITQNASTNGWKQGSNASLTISAPSTLGTLTASATGNTVTYNGTSNVLTPASNTYYNLAGTRVVCPVSFTILGTSPCSGSSQVIVTRSPTSCTNVTSIGSSAWSATGSAFASDNVYATATQVSGNVTTNYLSCTGYGFTIPAGATINGIVVSVERKTSGGSIRDAAMRLIKAGTIGSTDRSSATTYTTSDLTDAHGGNTDLWNAAWTVADINASNFGAAFAAKNTSTTSTTGRTVSVDTMTISVIYTPGAAGPHHIQINHDGFGLTCAPETVTLRACADAACTSLYLTGGFSVTPSPGGSAVTIGTSGTATATVSRSTAGTVTLSAASSAANASTCLNTVANTSSCSMTFSNNGLSFAIPNMKAGTTANASLGALDNTCSAALNGTNSIQFYTVYSDPASGTRNVSITDNTNTVRAISNSSASPTSVPLAFSNGIATFPITYSDVGLVTVYASYPSSSLTGLGQFTAYPASFVVSNVKRTADNLANPAAANASGAGFIKAGDSFTMTVTAMNALPTPTATPNFGLESTAERVTLQADLIAPAGGNNPSLTGALGSFSGGVATGTAFSWHEVGIITVTPRLASGNYMGIHVDVVGTASSNIGRFYPHHFSVVPDDLMPIDNRAELGLCSAGVLVSDGVTPCPLAYTYMGEPMNAQFTLEARATDNGVTQNYDAANGFAKFSPSAAGNPLNWGAVDLVRNARLTARLDTSLPASGAFNGGSAYVIAPLAITRSAVADGPFANLSLGVAPVDSDGVAILTAELDLDTDLNAVNDHALVVGTEVRNGRIKLSSASGSELLSLSMPLLVQYWNGAAYVTSVDDNYTTLAAADFTLSNYRRNLNSGETVVTSPVIVGGGGMILLSAPGAGNSGSVDIVASAPSYLPGNAARATFGISKSARGVIYLRENY